MRVVFLGYSEMGCAGLETLLELGAEVLAVFTHEDNPAEKQWFRSVAGIAGARGIPVFRPEDINAPDAVATIYALAPEVLFSFYYRKIVSPEILAIPPMGCLNLHGSLLPRYRGRVPTNWAIIDGETETGVTLHEMVKRADAGKIVGQKVVPIAEDDTALTVMRKQVGACRELLREVYPLLVAGTAPRIAQDESLATKYGGRKAEDGRIDWSRPARDVMNLVRAVTDPYPGAFFDHGGTRVIVWWGRPLPGAGTAAPGTIIGEIADGVIVQCGSGRFLVTDAEVAGAGRFTGAALGRALR